MAQGQVSTITVCVCTYKRPDFLAELLESLARQETEGRFGFDIVVVDNDRHGSARAVVEAFSARHMALRVAYAVEPTQGISHARNRSVAMAHSELIAFVDDDECASPRWLAALLRTMHDCAADAVLGPVIPDFPPGSKVWAKSSRLFERPRYETGTAITSGDGRTGNALVRSAWVKRRAPESFSLALSSSGGEDHDFFCWMEMHGARLYWCDDGSVSERVPLERQRVRYVLMRRLRASIAYWRRHNKKRPRWRAWSEAVLGGVGGVLALVAGLAAYPFHPARAVRFWAKAANGFGRIGALTRLKVVGYGEAK